MLAAGGALLLVAGAGPAAAQIGSSFPYAPLSSDHTALGVSQYVGGFVNVDRNEFIHFQNPGRSTHVAAAIFYDHESPRNGGESELFVGCGLIGLSRHHSEGVDEDEFIRFSDVSFFGGDAAHVEVISVPFSPVSVNGVPTRVADGNGIAVFANRRNNGGVEYLRPLDPRLFTHPSDQVVPGQDQAMEDCICDELRSTLATQDFFEEFFQIDCF